MSSIYTKLRGVNSGWALGQIICIILPKKKKEGKKENTLSFVRRTALKIFSTDIIKSCLIITLPSSLLKCGSRIAGRNLWSWFTEVQFIFACCWLRFSSPFHLKPQHLDWIKKQLFILVWGCTLLLLVCFPLPPAPKLFHGLLFFRPGLFWSGF